MKQHIPEGEWLWYKENGQLGHKEYFKEGKIIEKIEH